MPLAKLLITMPLAPTDALHAGEVVRVLEDEGETVVVCRPQKDERVRLMKSWLCYPPPEKSNVA